MAQWLLLLKNFNKNRPIDAKMTAEFEKYFDYYWSNDKNYAMIEEEDLDILKELPYGIQSNIYKDFLF